MRFHVVGLPHTIVTKTWSNCAYTQKIYNFCKMMVDRGHEVYLYANEGSDAPCTEFVQMLSKDEMRDLIGVVKPTDNLKASFDPAKDYWRVMNGRAALAIAGRRQAEDFLCVIAGLCQKEIADLLPTMMAVEYGIGYSGTFAKYRVFESYAWMHTVYGAQQGADTANGNFYDAVIPNYYDLPDFPLQTKKEDYFLYIGRLVDRKGWRIAQTVCEKIGARLIVAGQGEFDGYGEYVGVVGPAGRAQLMGGAKAVFVPSLYLEPFGGVHAEAMLCGTPVITTDWGIFPETVNRAVGFRCRTLQDFVSATQRVGELSPTHIHNYAAISFSLEVVGQMYEEYFRRLLTLYGAGWYSGFASDLAQP
jgi:glycosyltransferase involved in cell wall biosynthesis